MTLKNSIVLPGVYTDKDYCDSLKTLSDGTSYVDNRYANGTVPPSNKIPEGYGYNSYGVVTSDGLYYGGIEALRNIRVLPDGALPANTIDTVGGPKESVIAISRAMQDKVQHKDVLREYTASGVFVLPSDHDVGLGNNKVHEKFVVPEPDPKDGWQQQEIYQQSWLNNARVHFAGVYYEEIYLKYYVKYALEFNRSPYHKSLFFNHPQGVLIAAEYSPRVNLYGILCESYIKWVRDIPVKVEKPKEEPFKYTGEWPDRHPKKVIQGLK